MSVPYSYGSFYYTVIFSHIFISVQFVRKTRIQKSSFVILSIGAELVVGNEMRNGKNNPPERADMEAVQRPERCIPVNAEISALHRYTLAISTSSGRNVWIIVFLDLPIFRRRNFTLLARSFLRVPLQ